MFLDQIDVISFTRALISLSGIDIQSPPSASSRTSALEVELSISFFQTFGFLEATESRVGSFYRK
jgi:hypothetical protein